MLAVFSSTIISPPEELIQAGNRTPSPKKKSSSLLDDFAHRFPSSVALSISPHSYMSYTHENQIFLQPREFAVKDEIFCMFKGNLDNLASLKQQYGLGKSANEVILVMEAYRALRDRAPYTASHMLGHLVGNFAFIIFDSSTSTVFVASDDGGKIPLFLGITADGYLSFSDDAEILRGSCGKSLASFPPGCFFSTTSGLKSFEHPKNKVTAEPAMEEEMWGTTFKVERPNLRTTTE
ncbi:Stem-specific protein TSJT1 [Acorus calamus]|uniref:Stem-specific protein TSJT1 n=1 Tax=Acorus calamus TaxID=4465 RepID=A0AAV9DCG4_ACOCL|nr:Stem-specific protein TSJT1 [Acorus calamus]